MAAEAHTHDFRPIERRAGTSAVLLRHRCACGATITLRVCGLTGLTDAQRRQWEAPARAMEERDHADRD